MTTILLDVTRLLTRLYHQQLPTGVDRVGLAYLHRYGPQARAVLSKGGFFKILNPKDSQKVFSALVSAPKKRSTIRRIALRALAAPSSDKVDSGVLLHTSHSGMEYRRLYRGMHERRIKTIFMVHDLIPLTHAEYSRPGVDLVHSRRIDNALAHADGLIANSQATLDSLADRARQRQASLPPCAVARLASGVTQHSAGEAPLGQPYFVILGTIEPRKNHWFMLHVWRRLVEMLGADAPKLVVIGRRGWECENVIDMLERCARLREAVIELPDCSDGELQRYLQHARALLFPSFVEGYGMPLVEALVMKTPVLASDLDVFHEIAGDVPEYLDPLDGPGWIARILAYARDASAERDAQRTRMHAFREPTWAEHFEQVDRFLETLGAP
ncbi:glycosyltransferase family 4 protein [Caballeronia cordobensis]|uniref:glycosyltransferase family 4 protein n=1 Tax=Caballeronia cordobensis TaxID=1353886 RepID=UPI0006AD7B7A|nr:glycosyltransferase family 1 protein [Caballeronia cordobensis]